MLDVFGFIKGIFEPAAKLIDDVHTSEEEKLTIKTRLSELQNQITTKFIELQTKLLEAQSKIIVAEAQGDSWLQRNWRPLTMLSFVAIVVNNHILHPYLSIFWEEAPMLDVPQDLWDLIKIGLGGYVVGRSWEKVEQAKAKKPPVG